MYSSIQFFTLLNAGLLVGNLVVFGLGLKLYTEILKDKSMDARQKHKRDSEANKETT
jgi:hypothetical protein